jgi:predicted MFS family arabinose efflux permease
MATAPLVSSAPRLRHGFGFWAVAYAYLAVMAFSAVPSPLFAIYRQDEGFSALTITLIYAVFAVGVVVSLFLVGHLSDWHGRRRVLAPAVLLSLISGIVLATSTDLADLILARVLNGLSVGAVTATATAWLAELHATHRPTASNRRAQVVATAANLGGIGFGPLVSGFLAQYVDHPLVVPYAVFIVALAVAIVAIALAPETRELPESRPRYRPQRVSVPEGARRRYFAAALAVLIAFAAFGVFSALAGTFLAGSLQHPSHALAGATVFAVFAAGVVAQSARSDWSLDRLLATGMATMVAGLSLVVVAAWLSTPSLGLFVVGGALTGAGAGALFKGALGTVVAVATEDGRAEALAGLFLGGYIGLAVPIIGVGVTLQFATPRVALLAFAVAIAAATAIAARFLFADDRRPTPCGAPVAVPC